MKRYYCDYCDKSFPDNKQNRRKHMKGGQHQSNEKLHYLNFKAPEEILEEESTKTPCQRFYRTGECSFGVICRFSHLTTQRRHELLNEIEERKHIEASQTKPGEKTNPTVEDWLESRTKRRRTEKETSQTGGGEVDDGSSDDSMGVGSLPPVLRGIPDLPPSLLPPSVESLLRIKDVEWG
ncbi:zinc finger matrin-type protein 5-like [Asterias rubens]|uniref:zinc finger matrin-type protein 5-like n=1 Tax=Asterias rubens TaxID=7604 RepID=UPI00145552F9|nr:zinc finger matrin-type protein 5-like [Asterias rubens]